MQRGLVVNEGRAAMPHVHENRERKIRTEMLIRKPAAEVFEAFVDPEITARFWFTKGSGRLEKGKRVRWDWEMFGVWDELLVEELVPGETIRVVWSDGSRTEWNFASRDGNSTFVTIDAWGFPGDHDEFFATALDQTGGYTIVLCSLKAWLEHGVQLHAVADKAPDAIVDGER